MKKENSQINSVKNDTPPKKGIAKAVALKYDGVNSPELVAKGQGDLAYEIVALAEESHVHIHYDPLLLDVLTKLELGDKIPETLYLAVAKIIAFAYYLQGKHPDKKNKEVADNFLLLPKEVSNVIPNETAKKIAKDISTTYQKNIN